jgi:hypothetical protein
MSHNSSRKFDRPLRIELRSSPRLLRGCLALYLVAGLSCLSAPVPGVLLVLLVLHFCHLYCTHIRMCVPTAICALSWDAARGWRIRQARGDWIGADPVLPVFVSHRLVAVRFRTGRFAYRNLLVVGQRCAADEFRRLRVRLIQSAYGNRDRAKIPGA